MAKLNDEQIKIAKSWLHDIFVAGGIYPEPKRAIPLTDYEYMYGERVWGNRRITNMINARLLCTAIKLRKVDTKNFIEYDSLLDYFSQQDFAKNLNSGRYYGGITKPATMLAKYISWFCSQYEFYWNDLATTTYERDEIAKTILGKALLADGCFLSQVEKKSTPKTRNASSTANSGTPKAPQNSFKAQGGLSGKAIDLISTPGQKEHLNLPIFSINGFDPATNKALEDTMYIRPVEANPASQAKYTVNNTNKVLFGKAKGYGYCQVYFTDFNDADAFMKKAMQNNIKLPQTITQIQVCQLKSVLSNGYFKIGTEYGPVYISASKLNESLSDTIVEQKEDLEIEPKTSMSKQEKWDRFEDSFYHKN